jgi:hypothetical protein
MFHCAVRGGIVNFSLSLQIEADERAAGTELYQVVGVNLAYPYAPPIYHRAVCRAKVSKDEMIAFAYYLGMMSRNAAVVIRKSQSIVRGAPDRYSVAIKSFAAPFLWPYQMREGGEHIK